MCRQKNFNITLKTESKKSKMIYYDKYSSLIGKYVSGMLNPSIEICS